MFIRGGGGGGLGEGTQYLRDGERRDLYWY